MKKSHTAPQTVDPASACPSAPDDAVPPPSGGMAVHLRRLTGRHGRPFGQVSNLTGSNDATPPVLHPEFRYPPKHIITMKFFRPAQRAIRLAAPIAGVGVAGCTPVVRTQILKSYPPATQPDSVRIYGATDSIPSRATVVGKRALAKRRTIHHYGKKSCCESPEKRVRKRVGTLCRRTNTQSRNFSAPRRSCGAPCSSYRTPQPHTHDPTASNLHMPRNPTERAKE